MDNRRVGDHRAGVVIMFQYRGDWLVHMNMSGLAIAIVRFND